MDSESTNTSTVPTSPQLVTPREAEIVDGRAVTFEWEPVDAARAYLLEVAADTAFEAIFAEEEVPAGTTTLTVADVFPTDEQTFFWRVLAKNRHGWSRGERVESFVSGTPADVRQDLQVPDEAFGPMEGLIASASQMVSEELAGQKDAENRHLEAERERGVAYEGIPSGQILGITVAILLAVALIVVVLFQWTNITEARVRAAALDPSDYTTLRQTELEATRKLSRYEVISEEAGTYRIPIDRAMELVANEAYQQGDRAYSPEAPFVPNSR